MLVLQSQNVRCGLCAAMQFVSLPDLAPGPCLLAFSRHTALTACHAHASLADLRLWVSAWIAQAQPERAQPLSKPDAEPLS